TLAFGLMRVVNMAHGSLYLLGGYFAFQIQDQGDVFAGGEPKHSWWFSAITASVLIGIIGLLIQQLLLRWHHGEMLERARIAIRALLLGLVSTYSAVYLPQQYTNYSILLVFGLLVIVLALRPLGLFGRPA